MFVPVGISNRHVHLTKADFITLFGKEEMSFKVWLKQPGNFASEDVVSLKTDKNIIENVRVIGPFRDYTQVELAATDARLLGVNPPVRASGDVLNGESLTIVGPAGTVLTDGVIIPQRHIHITKEEKEKFKLPDVVSLNILGEKGGILGDVHIKVAEESFFEVHLDTDEANAFRLSNNQELEIINQ